jgi:hypothetical protein
MLNVVDVTSELCRAFNLDALPNLSLEVISIGLKYLVVPVDGGLAEACITVLDLEERLKSFGAEFVFLFDIN